MEKSEQWPRVKELFEAALQRDDDKRETFLREACGQDDSLRAEVESLLSAHFEAIALTAGPFLSADFDPPAPESIGPYKLVRKLGEGGMGQVWLAEQVSPLHREVALKLLRAGVFESGLLKRFQAERQSLAMMDHPAIAKVFDAGSTPSHQPYLVMEYVPGSPITDYCDEKKLSICERLELFIKICDGVQHAHQKAIIHRDLKPANILVVEVDGKPAPRIIDFGLAKAATPLPDEKSALLTQAGSFLGTPGYMSPEQAGSIGQDIDTRTDVYSLGVVLYVLLTGFLPFETLEKSVQEILQQVREVDPPRPSARISRAKDSSTFKTAACGLEPAQLASTLQGDLDWIAMKALEKDRNRRYGTPSELAADVGRYLRHEPVLARPASTVYRMQKYVRRHRVGVALTAFMVLLLAGFTVIQARQLQRTTRERDRADRVTEYMASMFKVSDPGEARGNTITAREVLDKASKDIDSGLSHDPELQAQMMILMSRVYLSLGLYSRSETLARQAVAIRNRVLGPEHPQTLEAMDHLEWALNKESRVSEAGPATRENRFAEAEKLERETLAIRRRGLGNDDPNTARSMAYLASTLRGQRRYGEAETLQRSALAIRRRVLGPEHPDTLISMGDLAITLKMTGRLDEAEKLERDALEIERRVLGPEHPDTLTLMNNLAYTLVREKRYPEAERLLRETIDIQARVLGNDHPQTVQSMSDLAYTLSEEGRYHDEEIVLRKIIDINGRVSGKEIPNTLINLGDSLYHQGRYAEAEKWTRQAIEKSTRLLGPENSNTAEAVYNLACIEALTGRPQAALKHLNDAIEHGLSMNVVLVMETDPALKSLHGDPRFKQLVVLATERAAKH
ncbi:MAG TPA: serine/threonine-protein kinase [Terriglobales bacterium]|nr:serine/threonine-protein kinase [Terriglobales bacterium]